MIKRKMFMCKLNIILICKKIGSARSVQHKAKFPLFNIHSNAIDMVLSGKVKHQMLSSDLHQ